MKLNSAGILLRYYNEQRTELSRICGPNFRLNLLGFITQISMKILP